MDVIDAPGLIETYGLPGLIMVGMGWAVIHLWRSLSAEREAHMQTHRDHTGQLVEAIRTLDKAMEIAEGRRG